MNSIIDGLTFLFPQLQKILKIKATDQDVEDFMVSVVQQNMEYREKNNITRKDFFQLLVQLRNAGEVAADGDWETKINNNEKQMSIHECAAQSFLFYLAGFETSSSTISFCIYELARNPEYQKRLQQEIDEVLMKHNGIFTFEAAQEMKYMDQCIDGKFICVVSKKKTQMDFNQLGFVLTFFF